MSIFWIVSMVILWVVVFFLGFLLLGTLRALGLLSWRLEQLEATTPKRLGRDGLKPGKRAPDFTLASVNGKEISDVVARSPDRVTGRSEGLHNGAVAAKWSGQETAPQQQVSLHDFVGCKVLLVFTQSGCGPCQAVIPELNRLERGDTQVLVVNNGDFETSRKWSVDVRARFPVLAQDKFSISKKYEVFATPFAFLIDTKGVIVSKGIINNRQHIRYVLSGARVPGNNGHVAAETDDLAEGESAGKPSLSPSEEVSHV
jgi:peroxiredoxin